MREGDGMHPEVSVLESPWVLVSMAQNELQETKEEDDWNAWAKRWEREGKETLFLVHEIQAVALFPLAQMPSVIE